MARMVVTNMSKVNQDLSSAHKERTNLSSSEERHGNSDDYGDWTVRDLGQKVLPTSLEAIGKRIGVLVNRFGMDKIVQATNKSGKSINRYISGNEPPLGFIIHLSDVCNVSISWITEGECIEVEDIRCDIDYYKLRIKEAGWIPFPEENLKDEYVALLSESLRLAEQKLTLRIKLDGMKPIEARGGSVLTSAKIAPQRVNEVGGQHFPVGVDQYVPDGFALIPRLDIQASAGSGRIAVSEEPLEYLAFQDHWLRGRGINPSTARVLTARGDSMEETIRDGDVLLVDTSIDRVLDNSIYVVVYGDMVLVKRVHGRINGSLQLISDNPRYPVEEVAKGEVDDLKIAGRVMWFGRSI